MVAHRLIKWRKRVHVGKLRIGNGHHFGGRIEFHGARTKSDHGMDQREVFVLEALEVAHHARLRMVRIEHRMRKYRFGAHERRWNGI